MNFLITLFNVLILFLYLVPAFILVKTNLAQSPHAKTISSLLLYVTIPGLVLNSFQSIEFSWGNLAKIGEFFLVTLILEILLTTVLYFSLKKKLEEPKYRILIISGIYGNVGIFGVPLVTALYPDSPIVACYASVYLMSMTLLLYSVGVFALTGKKEYISPKAALLNPAAISVPFSVAFYMLKWYFPDILGNAVSLLGKSSTCMCMYILGMRLASVNLLDLFKRPFVYLGCGIKLILYPLFCYLCVYFIPFFDKEFKGSILILSGTPTATILLGLSELHECEQELTANVVLLSTILCIGTLPLLTLILIA